nr:hypothetical protein [Tanacetum cinerariifolium]
MLPLDVYSPSFEGTEESSYEVGDLSLEAMKDKEVAMVNGVFEGAFGALGFDVEALVDAMEPQFPLNYESEPGYIENYNSNPYDSSSFPQQYPYCEDCGDLPEANHCQTLQYTVNHPIFNAHNDLLTAKAQNSKILACCDDDDDYDSAITPNEPVDSLSIGDENLNTILATESDEFIKSCVENLVPNPSKSEGENCCDVPACFTTFSNTLFDADYEFDSVDDQSCSDEDVPEKIFSSPLFEEKINSTKIGQHHFNAEFDLIESMLNHDSSIISSSLKLNSLLDEFAGELTLLKSIPSRIDETDCHHENEIRYIERLLYDNSSPRPPEEFVSENSTADIESFFPSPIPVENSDSFIEEIDLFLTPNDLIPPSIEDDDDDSERDILIYEELLDNYSLSLPAIESFYFDIPAFSCPLAKPPDDQEKYPDLLSHRGFENFQVSAKRPLMIHGKNIPILDVSLFHFYPLD